MSTTNDEFEIMATLARYGVSLDTRNWQGLRDVFTVDIDYDFGKWKVDNLNDVQKTISSYFGNLGPTQHLLGTYRIQVDGDTATSNCYCYAMHQGKGKYEGKDFEAWIEYADELVRTSKGWRSKKRVARTSMVRGDTSIIAPE